MASGYAGLFRSDNLVLWEEDAQPATKGGSFAGINLPGPGSRFKIGGLETGEDGPETKRTVREDPSTH